MFTTRKQQSNPYGFVKMVKWCSRNKAFEGYVGYTKDGDIYLTWDVREDIPIFSSQNKIGNDLRLEDFQKFEEICIIAENRWIEEISETSYEILRSKEKCFFSRKVPTQIRNLRPIINYSNVLYNSRKSV